MLNWPLSSTVKEESGQTYMEVTKIVDSVPVLGSGLIAPSVNVCFSRRLHYPIS